MSNRITRVLDDISIPHFFSHETIEEEGRYIELQEAIETVKNFLKPYEELSEWVLKNNKSVFDKADIPKESKRMILNSLGYSAEELDD